MYIYIYIYRNCILVWELLFKPAQVGLLDDPLTSALLGAGLERGFPCSMAALGLLQNSLNSPRTPGARHSHTWHHKILAGVMQFDSTVQRPPSNFTVFAMSVQPANGDQMLCTNRIKSHQGAWWLGTQPRSLSPKAVKQTLPFPSTSSSKINTLKSLDIESAQSFWHTIGTQLGQSTFHKTMQTSCHYVHKRLVDLSWNWSLHIHANGHL